MRWRRLGMLALLGLSAWGCGPAEMVPMTPPGVLFRPVSTDTMDAEGESKNRGTVRNAAAPDGTQPTTKTGENPANPQPTGTPGAK